MKLAAIRLRHFRNIDDCEVFPDPSVNFLVGKNGQGKTSFIEAIGFLALLRSFKGAKTEEVLQKGAPFGEVSAILESSAPGWRTELQIRFIHENGRYRKVAFINGKPFRSSAQYLSQRFGNVELGFHSIVFNPTDHDLVRGEPSIRRTYLDRTIAAEKVEYLETLQEYQRLLDQRNAVLKSVESPSNDLLQGFTEPMARVAARITQSRFEWLSELASVLPKFEDQIAPQQPKNRVCFRSRWLPEIPVFSRDSAGHTPIPSLQVLERAFWDSLRLSKAAESRLRTTLVGPHRDDWEFEMGGRPLKGHGSQGEVRATLLAAKLAEIELFRAATGHQPLLLLDDFSSELDFERRKTLLDFLSQSDLQVFVTTTDNSLLAGKRYQVVDGKFEAE